MVKVVMGNLFESSAQTLVNTVNCVGVMGKGIALEFKQRFPEMFKDYEARCRRAEVKLGRPYLYKSLVPPWILNFPTKDHWRSVTKLEDIVRGLEHLLEHYKAWGITSLAVPPLGCGQGQLEWSVVGPTLYRFLTRMDIPVELYAPHGTPHEELQPEFLRGRPPSVLPSSAPSPEQRVRPAWVALVEILKRIEEQPYHWPVGHTMFQKIAYVATEEGLPTGLRYQRGSYGPFSPEMKRLTTVLANNGLIREGRLGRMLEIKTGRTHHDASKAYRGQLEPWEPVIGKVANLFMRMNTQRAEAVATVLFAGRALQEARQESPSEEDVVNAVMDWKQRRKPALDRTAIASTVRNLAALGWLRVKPSRDLPFPEEIALGV